MILPSLFSSSARWFALMAGLFSLLCLPLLLVEGESNYTRDEFSWHLPAIRQIRDHWPKLDLLRDSLSATAPGYHYVLAGISLLTGAERLPLRLVNFAVSLGVLIVLWRIWPAGTDPRVAFLALLPLAASNFFVKSASYIVTDNAALLAISGALSALFFAPAKAGLVRTSLLASAAVFIRQSSLWLVAPLAVRILSEGRITYRLLLILPPIAVLTCLVLSWNGLVPPFWHETHDTGMRLTPAAATYTLAVFALLSPAYYLSVGPAGWIDDLFNRWTSLGTLGGLSVALAGPNAPSHAEGRWGGYLWDLSAHMPTAESYSYLFLFLAPVGGALLAMMGRRLWLEAGSIAALSWLITFAAWAATNLINRQVFHRYLEPITLVILVYWLGLVFRVRSTATKINPKPLLLLASVQLVLTIATAYGRTFGFF